MRTAALALLGASYGWCAELGWEGVWKGSLVNLPSRPGAKAVEVTREIGPWPAGSESCAIFKTTYREEGQVRGVKDYRLCRTATPGHYVLDEGGGLKLDADWLGDVLVSCFRMKNLLLTTTLRVREGVMEEEIVSLNDEAPGAGVQSLKPRNVQRLVLRRQP
jgi:hypothetical protein